MPVGQDADAGRGERGGDRVTMLSRRASSTTCAVDGTIDGIIDDTTNGRTDGRSP